MSLAALLAKYGEWARYGVVSVKIARWTQTSINLVGGNVMKSGGRVRRWVAVREPRLPASLQQMKCSYDIGVDEVARTGNRSVHMRLRGQMQNMRNTVSANDVPRGRFVPQINFLKNILWIRRDQRQVSQVARVGKAIRGSLTSESPNDRSHAGSHSSR